MGTERVLRRVNGFRRVAIATGHVTDAASRATERFPERRASAVRAALDDVFEGLDLGPDDLLICGGARGGDLLAAAAARQRGVTVWVLLANPPDAFVATSVDGGEPHWIDDFWSLLARVPAWVLQPSPDRDDIYSATNEWMIETAQRQAAGQPVTVVAVWDGQPAQGEGGTGGMVNLGRRTGNPVVVVEPLA